MTMMDRTVASGKIVHGNAALNTAYLPSGLYLVNITNGSEKH